MNQLKIYLPILFLLAVVVPSTRAESKAPIIKHRPLTSAAMNQSLNFRAQVTSPAAPLAAVTLHFTTSTDSAPVKIPMKQLDGATWSGTIPAAFISGYRSINYYIDATTTDGLLTETDWYRIGILSLEETSVSPAASQPSGTHPESGGESTWVKPALIAGGAVVVAGGAVLLLAGGGGGGGGGGDSDAPNTDSAGTYAGSATTCYATSTNTTCESGLIAITISADGYATSDTLSPNQFMRSPLNGDSFTMMAETEIGQLIYSASIVNDRIIGSISGSGNAAHGSGTYSGTFNATRQ